jgi:hypothetical protein
LQEVYADVVIDVEARLDWVHTRKSFPFGMKAQLEVSREYSGKAKRLWQEKKWQKAYRLSLKSQDSMNKAQSIYSSAILVRR